MSGICGLIPARGGSKGLPRKNVRLLHGKPLLAYSLEAALASGQLQHTVVTTEDREIRRIALDFGAEVIDRPPELATDEASTLDVVLHAVEWLEEAGLAPEMVALLQPTSPLRTAADIAAAVALSLGSGGAPVISVAPASHPPHWSFTLEGGCLRPLLGHEYLARRRQDLPQAYLPNGSIYLAGTGYLKARRGFLGPETLPYVMPADRSVDIDTELDFRLCELLLKK